MYVIKGHKPTGQLGICKKVKDILSILSGGQKLIGRKLRKWGPETSSEKLREFLWRSAYGVKLMLSVKRERGNAVTGKS